MSSQKPRTSIASVRAAFDGQIFMDDMLPVSTHGKLRQITATLVESCIACDLSFIGNGQHRAQLLDDLMAFCAQPSFCDGGDFARASQMSLLGTGHVRLSMFGEQHVKLNCDRSFSDAVQQLEEGSGVRALERIQSLNAMMPVFKTALDSEAMEELTCSSVHIARLRRNDLEVNAATREDRLQRIAYMNQSSVRTVSAEFNGTLYMPLNGDELHPESMLFNALSVSSAFRYVPLAFAELAKALRSDAEIPEMLPETRSLMAYRAESLACIIQQAFRRAGGIKRAEFEALIGEDTDLFRQLRELHVEIAPVWRRISYALPLHLHDDNYFETNWAVHPALTRLVMAFAACPILVYPLLAAAVYDPKGEK